MLSGRREWLSITPEPERVLPRAIATMRAGASPPAGAVERERKRAEQLVLHGSRRSWLAWLREVEELANRVVVDGDDSRRPELDAARREALAVIRNHNALMLGLTGRVAAATTRAQEEDERR